MRLFLGLDRGSLGDMSFTSKGTTKSFVAFVRNNVACVVYGSDVFGLAAEIDAKIAALPDLTLAEFNASKPVITTFAPQKPTLVGLADTTTLNIVVSDPTGEPLKRLLSSSLRFKDNRNSIALEPGDVAEVEPGESNGVSTVNMTVVNDSLQFSKAQTTVEVVRQ